MSQRLKSEFPTTNRLRMHTDYNEEELTLVYEYYRHTLLTLLNEFPDFPITGIKDILRCTGGAVKEFHDKDWIRIGITSCTRNML